ncbi:MAG TPA: nuclear transport factor 2 family protein [Candidatus Limnocylindrales bacterium]|jgi:hypothetical protein|nr:nuclear transport factor 2 family protein [Candidatus Limnocylindrales bacterium]
MTSTTATIHSATAADAAAIRATIADYYLGWYDADADRMARALHPELAKRGWIGDAEGALVLTSDTRETMVEGARQGRGRTADPDRRGYTLGAIEVHGDIASANVYAVPYVDYLHLVRTDDGWRIINALWCRP